MVLDGSRVMQASRIDGDKAVTCITLLVLSTQVSADPHVVSTELSFLTTVNRRNLADPPVDGTGITLIHEHNHA